MYPRILPPELHNLTIKGMTHRSFLHFAQTSSAWRVMLYFSHLKKAHAAADHPLQQTLLTALFIHYPLLLKAECKSALRDGIDCLRQYRTARDILPESRLIVLGLLLIIDPENTKQHQREFLLTSICLVDTKPSLVNAALTILARSKDNTHLSELCVETGKQLFETIENTLLPSVSEALLVLASLPLDEKNNTYIPLVVKSFRKHAERSLDFLHAALKLLPTRHAFWSKENIVHFIYKLPSIASLQDTAAFTSLINTLNTFANYDTASSFLDDFLKDSTRMTGTSPLTEMIEKSVAVIQLTDEQSKVRWLENNLYPHLSPYWNYEHSHHAICLISQILLGQLEGQEALQTAFWHLYLFVLRTRSDNEYLAATVMIKLLSKIQEKSFWEKWINTLCTDFKERLSLRPDTFNILISGFSFIPSEEMVNELLIIFYEKEDPAQNEIYCKLLPALFWQLSTPELVIKWINTLTTKIIPITLDRPQLDLTCYGILLTHLSSDGEMQNTLNEFLPALRAICGSSRHRYNAYKTAEKLLPHLKDDKEIDLWFDLFEELDHVVIHDSETNNRDLHITCVTALLQIASTDAKPRYENKFKARFVDNNRCTDQTILSALVPLAYKYKNTVMDKLIDMVLFAYQERSRFNDRPESLAYYLEGFFGQEKGVELRTGGMKP